MMLGGNQCSCFECLSFLIKEIMIFLLLLNQPRPRVQDTSAKKHFQIGVEVFPKNMFWQHLHSGQEITNDGKNKENFDFESFFLKELGNPKLVRPIIVDPVVVAPVYRQQAIHEFTSAEHFLQEKRMKYEILRFCSFENYPTENKPYMTRFAQAGFYYDGNGDEVICYCCTKRKRNWSAGDNPMEVHKNMSPFCRFLTKNREVNIPVGPEELPSGDTFTRCNKTGNAFNHSNLQCGRGSFDKQPETNANVATASPQTRNYSSKRKTGCADKRFQTLTTADVEKQSKVSSLQISAQEHCLT